MLINYVNLTCLVFVAVRPRTKSDPSISQPSSSSGPPGVKTKLGSLKKSGPDMSPDLDTSQEFTTADFYIDESMPSSIESPPKAGTEAKANLEQRLAVEKQINIKLQQELHECNTRLHQSELKLKSLKTVIDENIPGLHEMAKLLKSEQSEFVQKSLAEVENVRKALVNNIEKLGASISASNENVKDQLRREQHVSEKALNDVISDKDRQVKELEEKLASLSKDLDSYKGSVERLNVEKDELSSKYAGDISDMTLKHELELEVEVDKAKSEILSKVAILEKEIESKNVEISDKQSAIKSMELQRIKLEEELTDKFQKEKETICSILGAEYDEKLEKTIKDEQERMKTMQESLVAELNEKYEKEKSLQLAELKESLMVEKTKAVEMTQSTLQEEHTKTADEIKQKLLLEKETDLSKLKEKLESDFQEKLAKFSREFLQEKEHLEVELQRLSSKELVKVEVQTDASVFGNVEQESQTDNPSSIETQVQTEMSDLLSTSMQTFSCELTSCAVQTDSLKNLSTSMQTESLQLMESIIQTEQSVCVEICVQTDVLEPDHCDKPSVETEQKQDISSLKEELEKVS